MLDTFISTPWTLWTAAWVHLSLAHALANLLALAAIVVLAWQFGVLHAFGRGLLWVWPLSTLSLVFCPQVTSYAGASGVVHGAASLLGLLIVKTQIGRLLLLGLLLKLVSERAWELPIVYSVDWGFNVVQIAHLYGAIAGLMVGLAARLNLLNQRGGRVTIDKR
jgi:membrane associated rhomboid family serine protease